MQGDSLLALLEQNWKVVVGTLVVTVPAVWTIFHFVYRERISTLKDWLSRKDDEICTIKIRL